MKKAILVLLVPLVFACGGKNHSANISIVKQYVEAVENLDYTAMESLLSEDYEGYGPSAGDTIGKVAAVENWKRNVEDLYEKIEYQRSQFAGVTYYAQWKVSRDDFGVTPPGGPFLGKHEVYGIGPEIMLPLASKSKLYGFASFRYFWETGARSTLEGETFLLTLSFPMPSVSLQ